MGHTGIMQFICGIIVLVVFSNLWSTGCAKRPSRRAETETRHRRYFEDSVDASARMEPRDTAHGTADLTRRMGHHEDGNSEIVRRLQQMQELPRRFDGSAPLNAPRVKRPKNRKRDRGRTLTRPKLHFDRCVFNVETRL